MRIVCSQATGLVFFKVLVAMTVEYRSTISHVILEPTLRSPAVLINDALEDFANPVYAQTHFCVLGCHGGAYVVPTGTHLPFTRTVFEIQLFWQNVPAQMNARHMFLMMSDRSK